MKIKENKNTCWGCERQWVAPDAIPVDISLCPKCIPKRKTILITGNVGAHVLIGKNQPATTGAFGRRTGNHTFDNCYSVKLGS